MIEVKELVKKYGPTIAVDGISFEANAGEILGFLGPNGAGKTTTMRVITCYIPADHGSATVGGFDIFENSTEVRKQIGYLPENAPLYADMGVIEYLNFIAQVRDIPKNRIRSRISEMVEICGLGSMIHKEIGELSKGFRQRVGLAQALIHEPPVLILDEPTSGLDPTQIIEIRNLIREIGKEKTVIFSTHILSEVSATCDRVLIINDGKIVANGTPDELSDLASGEQIVYTSIRGEVDQISAKFGEIDFISDFKQIAIENGITRFQITSTRGHNTAEAIFDFVVQNGWSLTELRQETISLEDVFLKLTKGEGN